MSHELAAEEAYRECDPMNLDGAAMDRPGDVADALAVVLDEFDRRVAFYRNAIAQARHDPWKSTTFGSLLGKAERLIEVSLLLIEHGEYDAADLVLKEAILDYQTMVDRIDDLRSDPLP